MVFGVRQSKYEFGYLDLETWPKKATHSKNSTGIPSTIVIEDYLAAGEVPEVPRVPIGEMPWIVAPSSIDPFSEIVGVETFGCL